MSFPAQVFRVLIASPSDVSIERDIAVRAIQEWNDLNASERRIVLLPLKWETHSAPEYGKRPQEVINRQVVDHCDLLVGIFWTRIGSPTGIADSGTIEEIERIAEAGKPVMLYFSGARQDPDKIDLDQLSKLREFKKKTFPLALVESYADHVEFKDKLAKQIEIQLRTLIAEQGDQELQIPEIRPVTDIVLHFGDFEKGTDIGTKLKIQTRLIEIEDFDTIPDYGVAESRKMAHTISAKDLTSSWLSDLRESTVNKEYLRQKTTFFVLQEYFRPLRFWCKNCGGVGARDIHIQLELRSEHGKILLLSKEQLPSTLPSKTSTYMGLLGNQSIYPNSPNDILSKSGEIWNTHFEISTLQPQRELSPAVELLIGANNSDEITILATIYADTLAEPIHQELQISIEVSNLILAAGEIVNEVIQREI